MNPPGISASRPFESISDSTKSRISWTANHREEGVKIRQLGMKLALEGDSASPQRQRRVPLETTSRRDDKRHGLLISKHVVTLIHGDRGSQEARSGLTMGVPRGNNPPYDQKRERPTNNDTLTMTMHVRNTIFDHKQETRHTGIDSPRVIAVFANISIESPTARVWLISTSCSTPERSISIFTRQGSQRHLSSHGSNEETTPEGT